MSGGQSTHTPYSYYTARYVIHRKIDKAIDDKSFFFPTGSVVIFSSLGGTRGVCWS